MKKVNLLLVVLFLISLIPANVIATPVQWSNNGHWYEVVSNPLSWDDARSEAEGMSYNGLQGHLVTLTSAEENAFVWSIVENPTDYNIWLGGYQMEGATSPRNNWAWVTGESWGYSNWAVTEPNDIDYIEDGTENHLVFKYFSGKWNDLYDLEGLYPNRYIVEYEASAPVPEPATMLLLGAGLLGLAGSNRKRFRNQ